MPAIASFRAGSRRFQVEGVGSDDRYLRQVRGRFEPKLQGLCALLLRDGDIAIDVGANIGATSMILAGAVGAGRVISIEPGPNIYGLLSSNITRNGLRNIQALNCAAGSGAGLAQFQEDSSFGYVLLAGKGREVQVRSIDEIVADLRLPRVDFIKIDTEGFEPHVLAGARETIARHRPIIYFELNVWTLMAHSRTDPFAFMQDVCGIDADQYRVAKATPDLALEPLLGNAHLAVRDCMVYNNSLNDILLVPKGSERAHAIQHLIDRRPSLRSRWAHLARRIGRRLG